MEKQPRHNIIEAIIPTKYQASDVLHMKCERFSMYNVHAYKRRKTTPSRSCSPYLMCVAFSISMYISDILCAIIHYPRTIFQCIAHHRFNAHCHLIQIFPSFFSRFVDLIFRIFVVVVCFLSIIVCLFHTYMSISSLRFSKIHRIQVQ